MKQQTFAVGSGFERYGRQTRRAEFLAAMELVVPWTELVALIEPHYPKPGNGRPPVGVKRMLRIDFLQQWFNLSDPGIEERPTTRSPCAASQASTWAGSRRRTRPRSASSAICSNTTSWASRCGPGQRVSGEAWFEDQHRHHRRCHHPGRACSTKNQRGERDPEMHQVKKGNQWHFGMKAHVGVDAGTKLVHSVAATAAHVADSRVLPELLHGGETDVWGDQAYQGQAEVIRQRAPQTTDRIHRRWRTKLKTYPEVREDNRIKSQTRSRVEHVFALIKLKFGFSKVRYRGLAKNLHRLFSTCALVNDAGHFRAGKHAYALLQQICIRVPYAGIVVALGRVWGCVHLEKPTASQTRKTERHPPRKRSPACRRL